MPAIVLATLNARYTHASLGLRYLRANLGAYRDQSVICEFTTKRPPQEIAQEILALQPRVVGLGVYIWNTGPTLEVVRHLKFLNPELIVVAGGPEISFETETQELHAALDYVFQGEGDFSFRDFIAAYFTTGQLPAAKIIAPVLPDIKKILLPYSEYTDEDIAHRTLYVEASRGCPYKCEYCLSALDVSVRNFVLDEFLDEMKRLIDRGARQFKFVDRTFNLAPTVSGKILEFFLAQMDLGMFLHFEMVPDRLGDELKEIIKKFPAGALQFEIGVQTWSTEVARNVSRRQNYQKIVENFQFLRRETKVHTHSDLIVGLPGETFESFAAGFNSLYELQPDEIQVGILKRLKGTPIIRHDEKFGMRYRTEAPFEIIANRDMSESDIARLKIFAEFWDSVANSGRFPGVKELASEVDAGPFQMYFDLAMSLHAEFGRTHSIHLVDLERAVQMYMAKKGWSVTRGIALQKPRGMGKSTPARQAHHLAH